MEIISLPKLEERALGINISLFTCIRQNSIKHFISSFGDWWRKTRHADLHNSQESIRRGADLMHINTFTLIVSWTLNHGSRSVGMFNINFFVDRMYTHKNNIECAKRLQFCIYSSQITSHLQIFAIVSIEFNEREFNPFMLTFLRNLWCKFGSTFI